MAKPDSKRSVVYARSNTPNWFQRRNLKLPIRLTASIAATLIVVNIFQQPSASALLNKTKEETPLLGPASLGKYAFSHTEGPWNPQANGLDANQTKELIKALDAIAQLDDSSCTYDEQISAMAFLVNKFRERLGVNDFTLNTDLSDAAKFWSEQMAVDGYISHSVLQDNLSKALSDHWLKLGENVSVSKQFIMSLALMELSRGHERVLADPVTDSVGIGYTLGDDGESIFLTLKTAKLNPSENLPIGDAYEPLEGQKLLEAVNSIVQDIYNAQRAVSNPFVCYSNVQPVMLAAR